MFPQHERAAPPPQRNPHLQKEHRAPFLLEFIRVFEEEAGRIGAVDFLVQGTIYPDVVESGLGGESAVIKSHHNVGGLPDCVDFKEIIERRPRRRTQTPPGRPHPSAANHDPQTHR